MTSRRRFITIAAAAVGAAATAARSLLGAQASATNAPKERSPEFDRRPGTGWLQVGERVHVGDFLVWDERTHRVVKAEWQRDLLGAKPGSRPGLGVALDAGDKGQLVRVHSAHY